MVDTQPVELTDDELAAVTGGFSVTATNSTATGAHNDEPAPIDINLLNQIVGGCASQFPGSFQNSGRETIDALSTVTNSTIG